MQLTVIDVSEHQKKINWEKVKPQIDGAIIRCGYGDNDVSQDDKYWAYNVKECERLGIPFGVYLYSYAATEAQAKSEAEHAIRLCKGHKLSYPVYIDFEERATGSMCKRVADIFCAALENAGYCAGVYSYESYWNDFLRGYDKYTIWIAKYSATKPNIGVKYDAWQFTSGKKMSGITENTVDVSYFYRDFPAEIAGKSTPTATGNGTATKVLEVAASQIGNTDGTKYGKWYENNVDRDANNYNFGARGVLWCAMFVSWVFNKAGAKCIGLPGAYCPSMLKAAVSAKKTIAVKSAQPGDVVYFDWDGGESDHVGIVESNDGRQLHTIEGNTDNGIVARKIRPYSCVVGVVRPDYAKQSTTPTNTTTSKPAFRVSVDSTGKKWLGENKLKRGSAIRWLAIKGVGKYRVFTRKSGWLPYVDGYNVNDLEDGCAGDGSCILAVEVYSSKYRYAVRILKGGWYPDMIGRTDTAGSTDHFAGDLANSIDGFRISKV